MEAACFIQPKAERVILRFGGKRTKLIAIGLEAKFRAVTDPLNHWNGAERWNSGNDWNSFVEYF